MQPATLTLAFSLAGIPQQTDTLEHGFRQLLCCQHDSFIAGVCYHCVVERKAAITVRAQALLQGIRVVDKDHPIMKGVSAEFGFADELYMMNAGGPPDGASKIKILAETSVSVKSGERHAAVWITEHPKARIVGYTLGHDERAHDHPDYIKILINATQWVAGN